MEIDKLINECEKECNGLFLDIENKALFNQEKVLNAFQKNKIALRHFNPTTGYGYDDIGRDKLAALFADIFKGETAIVSPLITSGTHAISTVLFGLLRPGDTMLSISGKPYDTLDSVISQEGIGSLRDFNINYEQVDLINGSFDVMKILSAIKKNPKIIFIQRSRGYSWRNALSIKDIENIIAHIRKVSEAPIVIDNCYGEFVDEREPLEVGANIIVGSLIKNPGGGLAPSGGYIIGDKTLMSQIEGRFTVPGIGCEVGSYAGGYQAFYQGIFMSPHVTSQALKGSVLFGSVFTKLGYETLPKYEDGVNDIIRSIKFNTKEELILFCQSIQKCSPIDSFAVPYPWDMPGYSHQVIMAAGTFVQGASIELSADSPICEPYIGYLQGGLTFEHVKLALKHCVEELKK